MEPPAEGAVVWRLPTLSDVGCGANISSELTKRLFTFLYTDARRALIEYGTFYTSNCDLHFFFQIHLLPAFSWCESVPSSLKDSFALCISMVKNIVRKNFFLSRQRLAKISAIIDLLSGNVMWRFDSPWSERGRYLGGGSDESPHTAPGPAPPAADGLQTTSWKCWKWGTRSS